MWVVWFLRQGLCIFMRSQNLMDFAFETKKEKHKTIKFGFVSGGK